MGKEKYISERNCRSQMKEISLAAETCCSPSVTQHGCRQWINASSLCPLWDVQSDTTDKFTQHLQFKQTNRLQTACCCGFVDSISHHGIRIQTPWIIRWFYYSFGFVDTHWVVYQSCTTWKHCESLGQEHIMNTWSYVEYKNYIAISALALMARQNSN